MTALDDACVDDGEEKRLGLSFGRGGGGDRLDVNDEDSAELAPKGLQHKVGWTVAVTCVSINIELVLMERGA